MPRTHRPRLPHLRFERSLLRRGYELVVGVDEAGRGPLAGPVVAAAVALRTERFTNRIDDSKKLTPRARERAFLEITAQSFCGVGIINEKVIDLLNIRQATRLAMQEAVTCLLARTPGLRPGAVHVLVDGTMPLELPCGSTLLVRGDQRSQSIASASIVAKVIRDRIMTLYDAVYPHYNFRQHKGYGTERHMHCLRRRGLSPIHRRSFCHG